MLLNFIFLVTVFVSENVLADDPKKCKIEDSDCLKLSAQEYIPSYVQGIPEIDVVPLDTMHIDVIKIDLAGLKLVLKDSNVTGLRKTKMEKIGFDTNAKQMKLSFTCDINLRSKYKASGRLLILPITGDGDFILKLKGLTIDLTMPYKINSKDGNDVLDLSNFKYKYEVKDNAHFTLTNLFNGNKQLSETMLSFMNTSWKILIQEFGPPVLEPALKVIFSAIKNYIGSKPLAELFAN